MPIIRASRPDRDFTVVANRILNDPRLSWAARGMLVHLLSKPDHWSVNVHALINETQASARGSGRDAVYRTLDELGEAGYIVRKRHANGSVITTVYEDPLTEIPEEAKKPNPENPDGVDSIGFPAPFGSNRACPPMGDEPHPEKPHREKPDRDNPDVLVKTEFIERTEEVEKPDASLAIVSATAKRKARRGTKVTLRAFLDECKADGREVISDDDPIFVWAKKTRVPVDMLFLCWQVFKEKHVDDAAKLQIDWRAHFRNAVKGSWYRLWYFDTAGECRLTTAGEQAHREHELVAA
jgi:hypothetical protein